MMEFFRSWIMNIVTAVVFMILVEIMITNDKFKKYVKLATGLVLMIIIINPIVTLFNKNLSLDSLTIQSFNNFDQREAQAQTSQLDDMKNAQIIGVFKQKLQTQIRSEILSIKDIEDAQALVTIDQDPASETFGQIRKIDVTSIKPKRSQTERSIQKVEIDISKDEAQVSEDVIQKVKEKLARVYEISNENINIKTQAKGEG